MQGRNLEVEYKAGLCRSALLLHGRVFALVDIKSTTPAFPAFTRVNEPFTQANMRMVETQPRHSVGVYIGDKTGVGSNHLCANAISPSASLVRLCEYSSLIVVQSRSIIQSVIQQLSN